MRLCSCNVVKSTGDFANSVSAFTFSSSVRIKRFAWERKNRKPIWVKNRSFWRFWDKRVKNTRGWNLTQIDEVEKHLSEEFSILGFGVSFFLDGEHLRDDSLDGGFALSKKLNRRFHRIERLSPRVFRYLRLHNSFVTLSLRIRERVLYGGSVSTLQDSSSIRFINLALHVFVVSQFRPQTFIYEPLDPKL